MEKQTAHWNTKVYDRYYIDQALVSLVGTRERWAPHVIPGCYYADGKGFCCQKPAETRIRLRGGLLVQDDDQLVCSDHLPVVEKQMQQRIGFLEENNRWLMAWAQQNPPSFDENKGELKQTPS